jgi:tetratricopeptide (TPR) repeat protein
MASLSSRRGRFEEALAWIDRAIEMNPLPPAWYDSIRYDALHFLGRYGEAAAALARLPDLNGWRSLRMAAIQLGAGNESEARRWLARARSLLAPGDWVAQALDYWNMERPEDRALLERDLRAVLALPDPA